jgi:DNA segregation ATPase FtsK/SpoIIIE, S-DNA-T family
MARGEKVGRGPIQLRAASVRVPLSAVILGWLGRTLGRALMWVLSQPVLWVALTVYGIGYWLAVTVGPWPFVFAALLLGGVLRTWRDFHRPSYRRWLAWPIRSAFRRAVVYRRFWQPAMVTTNLAVRVTGREYLPKLVKVASTGFVDRVTVRMLPGQVAEDYAEVTERLAQTFGAVDCRVRTDPKHRDRLVLWFLVHDPLTEPVAPFDTDDPADLTALPVAKCEDGLTYRLRLLGTHILWVAATGAGKSSAIWAMIHALAPAVRSGLVQLWVCDPKGGMELAPGQRLFTRFCHGAASNDTQRAAHEHAYAQMLEDAVDLLRERQGRLRGITRLHEPCTAEPVIVVVLDELAALTAYLTDRDAKRRIAAALSLLLSQGRAVGVLVVAALQDPRKEVLPARDLFPTRIALRVTEPEQVDMVLGDGTRKRGARCDQIPEALPGVGYVSLDGTAEPVRVRFAHISDNDIAVLAQQYPAPAHDPASDSDDAAESRRPRLGVV